MSTMITIEVAFALPKKQTIIEVAVAENTTVQEAIESSGILTEYPEIDLKKNKAGIWGRVVKMRDTLRDGDRIEIYRPLIADPKEIRKRRAEKAKEEGRADKVTGGRPNPLKAENKE